MSKTIKHMNLISATEMKSSKQQYLTLEFICRGCQITQSRKSIWNGWRASMVDDPINIAIDNSRLTLEEEPSNQYDPSAIIVVCRGEFFGTAGYVGREFTSSIKKILNGCKDYRVDVADPDEIGEREVTLILTYRW